MLVVLLAVMKSFIHAREYFHKHMSTFKFKHLKDYLDLHNFAIKCFLNTNFSRQQVTSFPMSFSTRMDSCIDCVYQNGRTVHHARVSGPVCRVCPFDLVHKCVLLGRVLYISTEKVTFMDPVR